MILRDSQAKVYLITGYTDMRKAIDGLSIMVQAQLDLDPFSGHLFVFCNRSQSIIKILYWDVNGFCLWQKKLEKQRFKWPKSESEVMCLEKRQLAWLLDGLDLVQVQGHKALEYSTLF
jgi:transposase